MWFMVCCWPQSQEGADSQDMGLGCPEMVEQRLCVTSEIKIWLWIVGSATIEWLTTEADDQSSLHCVVVSTGAMSDHTGH